jgi:cardiolipin synthase
MVPFFAVTYLSDFDNSKLIAGAIYAAAAITDVVDGYLARKWNQITKLGRILDPLADKLLQVTALFCLMIKGIAPVFIVVIFAAKELLMVMAGSFMVRRLNDVMPSNVFGKAVSFFVSAVLVFSIFFKDYVSEALVNGLLYAAAGLTLAALAVYAVSFVLCLTNKKPVSEEENAAAEK